MPSINFRFVSSVRSLQLMSEAAFSSSSLATLVQAYSTSQINGVIVNGFRVNSSSLPEYLLEPGLVWDVLAKVNGLMQGSTNSTSFV